MGVPKNRGKCKSATTSLHRGDSLSISYPPASAIGKGSSNAKPKSAGGYENCEPSIVLSSMSFFAHSNHTISCVSDVCLICKHLQIAKFLSEKSPIFEILDLPTLQRLHFKKHLNITCRRTPSAKILKDGSC